MFFSVSGSWFVEMIVGAGESCIRFLIRGVNIPLPFRAFSLPWRSYRLGSMGTNRTPGVSEAGHIIANDGGRHNPETEEASDDITRQSCVPV